MNGVFAFFLLDSGVGGIGFCRPDFCIPQVIAIHWWLSYGRMNERSTECNTCNMYNVHLYTYHPTLTKRHALPVSGNKTKATSIVNDVMKGEKKRLKSWMIFKHLCSIHIEYVLAIEVLRASQSWNEWVIEWECSSVNFSDINILFTCNSTTALMCTICIWIELGVCTIHCRLTWFDDWLDGAGYLISEFGTLRIRKLIQISFHCECW